MPSKKYTVTYRAGGYPSPTYTGSHTVMVNIPAHTDLIDVMEYVASKAKREVARSMAMQPRQITITDIEEKGTES